MNMETVTLKINGREWTVDVEPGWSLLYVLREQLHFTGTKCGCNTSNCGACKVVVDGEAVNSCSLLASGLEGKEILTIEGMAQGETLHPIQQAFVDSGAVQCGFCTPGMVMTAKAFLDKNPNPTEEEVRQAIDKNLCRCTGYVKIVQAILLAAERMRAHG